MRAAAWVWLFRGSELHWDATSDFRCGPGIAIDIGDQREELLLELAQGDSILWPFGPVATVYDVQVIWICTRSCARLDKSRCCLG